MQVWRDYRLIECETTMRNLKPVALREVAIFKTADVAPVVHAHWNMENGATHTCTNCEYWYIGTKAFKYCPNCGAKMDEEEEKR